MTTGMLVLRCVLYTSIATLASLFEVHSYIIAGFQFLYTVIYSFELIAAAITVCCLVFGYHMFLLRTICLTVSVETQTDFQDISCRVCEIQLKSVYLSKAGTCFHLSPKCPMNGTNNMVQEFRRCRNCG